MQGSVLLVSDDEMLSRSRIALLAEWKTVTVKSARAWEAIATETYDLLILCQTVNDATAAMIAERFAILRPTSKVMVINRPGHVRSFGTVQYTLDIEDPGWLPAAVARTLSA